ncbi:ribonuclease H-like domain-containing protein [Tanacetum coccineum]
MSIHGNSDDGFVNDFVDDPVTLISRADMSDPLHLHPNDSTALIVVSIKLKETANYQVCSYAMLLALERKNKTGFIDGSCRRSNTDEVLERQWDRAKHVRKELKETYDKVDGSITFGFHHIIHTLKQNGLSIADYYLNLNALWKQFDFLMGIYDSYMQIRSSILSREILHDVRSDYVTISSEESHRVASGSIDGSSQRNQASTFVSINVKGKNISNNNSVGSSSSSGFTDEQMATLISIIKDNKVGKNVQTNMAVGHSNGTEAFIYGNLRLPNDVVMFDVLVVSKYRVTLIYVHKLAKDNKIFMAFDES